MTRALKAPPGFITAAPLTDQQPLDPERLAALLDGRLSTAEASAVRAQLTNADEDTLSAFADAVAIVSGVGGVPAGDTPQVVSLDRARRFRWVSVSAVLLAAGLVGAIVLRPHLYPRAPLGQAGLIDYASSLPSTIAAPTTPVWGNTRGGASVVSEAGRSVRMGALLTDLAIALSRGDPVSGSIAESMASYLGDVATAGSIANDLRDAARGASATRNQELHRLALQSVQFVDEPLARAGAWIEAARLASAAGDMEFFSQFPAEIALKPLDRPDIQAVQAEALKLLVAHTRPPVTDRAALRGVIEAGLKALSR